MRVLSECVCVAGDGHGGVGGGEYLWGVGFLIDLLSPFGMTLHLLLRLCLGLMRHSSSWDQHTLARKNVKKQTHKWGVGSVYKNARTHVYVQTESITVI